MSKKNNLTEIWNVYADSIIKEAKTSRPIDGGYKKMSTKPGPGAVELDSKEAKKIQHTGNEGTTEPVYDIEGVHEPVDPKKKKGDKENLYEPEKYSSEKFDEKVEKTYREGININMKSVFDKLFEDVMGDESIEELDALGIDAEETDAEETDEITLTLDRDMAQQLCDLIQAQLGEEEVEDDDAGEEDYEGEEGFNSFDEAEEDEDEDETVDEATELKEVPSSAGHKLTSRHNTVGSVRASGGKAHGQVKSTVDGKGKPLADGKGKLTSKNNKVGGTKTGSTGGSFFA
jgi:hypothetical protein